MSRLSRSRLKGYRLTVFRLKGSRLPDICVPMVSDDRVGQYYAVLQCGTVTFTEVHSVHTGCDPDICSPSEIIKESSPVHSDL